MQEILEIFNKYSFNFVKGIDCLEVVLLIILMILSSIVASIMVSLFYSAFAKNGEKEGVFFDSVFFITMIVSSILMVKYEVEEYKGAKQDTEMLVLFEKELSPNQIKELNLSIAGTFKNASKIENALKDGIDYWSPTSPILSQKIVFERKAALSFLRDKKDMEQIESELQELREQKEQTINKLFKGNCLTVCERE